MIILGFPGTGKSYASAISGIPDSDSSKFPKEDFPNNYIGHLKTMLSSGRRVFASTHKSVRDALYANGMDFVIVYPHSSIKEEYLERYRKRGSCETFISLIEANWENWLEEIEEVNCPKVVLRSGETMMDALQSFESEILEYCDAPQVCLLTDAFGCHYIALLDSIMGSYNAVYVSDSNLEAIRRGEMEVRDAFLRASEKWFVVDTNMDFSHYGSGEIDENELPGVGYIIG